jgi:hypothetical protein
MEAKKPIPIWWALGMGRASGATGYCRKAVAGFVVCGKGGRTPIERIAAPPLGQIGFVWQAKVVTGK